MKKLWRKIFPKKQELLGNLTTPVDNDYISLTDRPIRFNVYRANGGTVIQVIAPEQVNKIDRHNYNLYVIANSDDISDTITKIITLESLKS
jgi:RPA family protein